LAGGGLSNLYDRLRKGYVVDYFSFGTGPKWFRRLVFNLADFFVFAGVLLCMIQMIRKDGKL
ncbi:MAG: signal peptidase II, partial [Eubacterium sp.]|nr:signal peptidase II [Eubacterium sp.]